MARVAVGLLLLLLLGCAGTVAYGYPCMQSTWNQTSGECYILNVCDFPIYGYAMCDHDTSLCGSSRPEGVVMCGHSKFRLGTACKQACQGLEWEHTNSTHCEAHGSCCKPFTQC